MSRKLSGFKPATVNANQHTQRGLRALQDSMRSVGYTEPMVAAADGEMLSGSARLETVADVFGTDVEPIIVESDGTRPIIHVRKDIPNAHTDAAKRVAIEANRIGQMDLDWNPDVLLAMPDELITALWEPEELSALGTEWANNQAFADALGALPTGDRAPFQQMTFTVSDQQAETVKRALDAAKKAGPFEGTGNENSNGNALARICEAYLGG